MNLTFLYGRGFRVTITPKFIAALSVLLVALWSRDPVPLLIEVGKVIFH